MTDGDHLLKTIGDIVKSTEESNDPYKKIKLIVKAIDDCLEKDRSKMSDKDVDLLYSLRNSNAMFLAGLPIEESIEIYDASARKWGLKE